LGSGPRTHERTAARTRGPAFRFAASTIRQIEDARRREFEAEIDANTRKMEKARAAGFAIETGEHYPGYRLWFVPAALVGKIGCKAAVVRV
jgi:hypothetical protein